MIPTLEPIDSVRPSTYNPRKVDPDRLALVELSLRAFGWLLPIYATTSGEILSGHQRHHVARGLGFKEVPIVRVSEMPLKTRQAVNLAFNRGTNDLDRSDKVEALTSELTARNASGLLSELEPIEPGSPASFPVLKARLLPIAPILRANRGRWITYARNVARTLATRSIKMPIIIDDELRVINGIGRLQFEAEQGSSRVLCLEIGDRARGELAELVLNLLSMSFDFEGKYGDLLRFNAFRHARQARKQLGRGLIFPIHPGTCDDFKISDPMTAKRWRAYFGSTVVDFGAGHLFETELLRSAGVDVTPFEPYHISRIGNKGAGTVDRHKSRWLARQFLDAVASGKRFTSVFCSSVLNQVPFPSDRRHILAILHALCTPSTRVFVTARSVREADWRMIRDRTPPKNHRRSIILHFPLETEEGAVLSDLTATPQIQKFFSEEEFRALLFPFFRFVKVSLKDNNAHGIGAIPLPVDPDRLRAALKFEFELPYEDGSTMGLSDQALEAFSERLAISL